MNYYLPTSIEIDGAEHPIRTDFRAALDIMEALQDPELDDNEKILAALDIFYLEDLETLPGIGPVLAERIIEYRERYGGFQSVEEIMYVSGIGEKTYAKIADLLKVEVER